MKKAPLIKQIVASLTKSLGVLEKAARASHEDPQQVFADWLDNVKDSGDRQQLEDIASDVTAALRSLPKMNPNRSRR